MHWRGFPVSPARGESTPEGGFPSRLTGEPEGHKASGVGETEPNTNTVLYKEIFTTHTRRDRIYTVSIHKGRIEKFAYINVLSMYIVANESKYRMESYLYYLTYFKYSNALH
jgi:hypothetical protein